jgi:outer membrane murein-binding lipoprotein Lpp
MEATLHLMVEQLRELKNAVNAGQEELKADINDVKTDVSTVTAGQEELKNDIENSSSAVKDEISAVKMTSRTASAL